MKIMGELLPLHVASKTKLGLRIFKKYATQKIESSVMFFSVYLALPSWGTQTLVVT